MLTVPNYVSFWKIYHVILFFFTIEREESIAIIVTHDVVLWNNSHCHKSETKRTSRHIVKWSVLS